MACGEICYDTDSNISSFWDNELDESPAHFITPEERERFELAYIDIPYPFRIGDIVRVVDSDRIGIVMSPRSETDYQEFREKLNKLKSTGKVDYSDCTVLIDFIDDNGEFDHDHISPLWLEYVELKETDPRKDALECARDLMIGHGSFGSFQRACDKLREKIKK